MFRNKYILAFISAFLLIVFALSITPKRYLHDIFAGHTDNRCAKKNGSPYQLGISGYNCDNDNLVATSSYLKDAEVFTVPILISFSSFNTTEIRLHTAPAIYTSLRGPPATI
ncbi:MAG: hypothetical protein ABIY51_14280 [Ferruginibacter sp.]